jgi:septin family protein
MFAKLGEMYFSFLKKKVCQVFTAGKQRNFKITFVGSSGTGKTTTIARLLHTQGYLNHSIILQNELSMDPVLQQLKEKGSSKTLDKLIHYQKYGISFDKNKEEIQLKKTVKYN